jgi:glycosyltransferase involved in cell wall biosynthesis
MRSLSIVIPTYNRPKQLLRLLKIISAEIEGLHQHKSVVNVLIRDNSDGVETKTAIATSAFAGKSWLDYKKNEKNVGFDSNILNSFFDASNDYVWFIGDDDIIFKGSLQKVIELIQLDVDMLHLPFKQPEDLAVPQYQASPFIKYWENVGDAVEQVLKNIKITSFVYRKAGVPVNREKLSKAFSHSGWMHVVIAFDVLMNSKKVKTVSINEFLAGSLDAEWGVINWTPAAYLTSRSFYQHDIFTKYNLNKQLNRFETELYFGGLDMTWRVTTGKWLTRVPIKEYIDFGATYPFRSSLFKKPLSLIKYFVVRFKLGPFFMNNKPA